MLTLITATLFASVVIIFIKLHRSVTIDPTERVSASRMVYYLSLGFISSVSDSALAFPTKVNTIDLHSARH